MPGTYHIIHFDARYRTAPVGRGQYRGRTRVEQSTQAACGQFVVRDRDTYCSIKIANPNWAYDWCHACVRAYPWSDDARKLWLGKGIETLDPASWEQWLQTPDGEYSRRLHRFPHGPLEAGETPN